MHHRHTHPPTLTYRPSILPVPRFHNAYMHYSVLVTLPGYQCYIFSLWWNGELGFTTFNRRTPDRPTAQLPHILPTAPPPHHLPRSVRFSGNAVAGSDSLDNDAHGDFLSLDEL